MFSQSSDNENEDDYTITIPMTPPGKKGKMTVILMTDGRIYTPGLGRDITKTKDCTICRKKIWAWAC